MQPEGAEGSPFAQRPSPAANEDFPGPGSAADASAPPRPGWDAFEVWRTRVKVARSAATPERELDPGR